MNVKIDLTEDQIKFLKQFAKNQYEGSPDNLGTYKPLHLVQTQVKNIQHDGGGQGDWLAFYDKLSDIYFDNEIEIVEKYGNYEDPNEILSFEQTQDHSIVIGDINSIIINDYDDYFKAYGVENEIEICSVIREYKTVAYFFILENAKAYIKYQGHNLQNPRTFTVTSGYGNDGEYEPFFDLLMMLGKKLNN